LSEQGRKFSGLFGRGLERPGESGYKGRGAILRVYDKEVMPLEQTLLNIVAAVVAGIIVLLVGRWFDRR
jgi:hypothetical protein